MTPRTTLIQSPIRFQTEQESRPALRVPKPINVVQVQAAATVIYTARDDADFQVENLVASNVSGAASYVTVHIVPSGGSASAANMIVHQLVVPANRGETIFNRENLGLLDPGATIQALCQANDDINMYGYGFDYQGIYS